MAVSEQRDLRQTSLEYVLLGETVDKDGNEVDLLVVAELRKRDNFRMQRRNGQKGRSLRPSPRELKGLYHQKAIKFVDDGEKRFREAMAALNIDLDSADVVAEKKAPTRIVATDADSALQSMTVAQLREMLKGLGGSIYAGGRQKNKSALIASIEELQGSNKQNKTTKQKTSKASARVPEPPVATTMEEDPHSTPVVDIEEGISHVAPVIEFEQDATNDETVMASPVSEVESEDGISYDTLVTIDDSNQTDSGPMASAPAAQATESNIKPKDETNGIHYESLIPSITFDDEFDVADIEASDAVSSTTTEAQDSSAPSTYHEAEDSFVTPDIPVSIDIDDEISDSDIDMDEMLAEIMGTSDDDVTNDENETPDEASPTSESEGVSKPEPKAPSILFNIPSDEDEKIDVINEDEKTENAPIRRPPIVVPSRRNRRNVPRRRQPTVSDTGSFMSPVPTVDKISLADNDDVTEQDSISDETRNDIDAMTYQSIANSDFLGTDNISDNESSSEVTLDDIRGDNETDDAPALEFDDGVPTSDADEDEPISIQEDEDDLIDIFDDLDSEGIRTSDDLIDALYSSDTDEEPFSDRTTPATPSYSGFEFAWSDKSNSIDPLDSSDNESPQQPNAVTFEDATENDGFDEFLHDLDDDLDEVFTDTGEFPDYGSPELDLINNRYGFDASADDSPDYLTSTEDSAESEVSSSTNGEEAAMTDNFDAYDDEASEEASTELVQAPKGGYPVSNGTNRGLNNDDRVLIRKTFRRMLIEVLVVAIIAILGIVWLVSSGTEIFPSISLP